MPAHDPNDRTTIDRVDPLVGMVLNGKYRLDARLASGGFGAIYQGRHLETGVDLAVKIVHARLSINPDVVARFKREGEALTALRSPHTITAYELGETSKGILYIAMELLRGVNLFERFRVHGPLPWRRMVAIGRGVCHSLAEAHSLGVVHRDLKPTNIHLERRGTDEDFVKVLDFGIAKILQHSKFDSSDLTSAGLMIGTIDYMSPEQMVGGEITGASDLYTLGIVMYEMIVGKRPFPEAPSAASVLAAMLKPPPPLGSMAIVPAELDRIVMRCLARDPADRYQTAHELSADLARLLESPEARSRSFDLDDDATQVAPKRTVSETLTAVVPPPSGGASSSGIRQLPGGAPGGRTTAPMPTPGVEPRRSTPVPTASRSGPLPAPPMQPTGARSGPITTPPPGPPPMQPPMQPKGARSGPLPAPATQPPMQPTGARSGPITMPPPGQPPMQPTGARSGTIPMQPPMQPTGARSGPITTPPPGQPPMQPTGARSGVLPAPAAPVPIQPLPSAARSGVIPMPPINTLRGVAIPQAPDGGRAVDATIIDPPTGPAGARRSYDASQVARRDALVRRLVWICVLAIAALIGVVLAAGL